jgi:16S rRNA (guanine1207-N2)-methyltransferase
MKRIDSFSLEPFMSRDTEERELRVDLVAEAAKQALELAENPLLVNGRATFWSQEHCWNRWKKGTAAASVWPEEEGVDVALLRLLPERAAMELALHCLAAKMREEGELWIVGANDEGIKSWPKRLQPWFKDVETIEFKRHCRLIRAYRTSISEQLRSDLEAWKELLEISIDGIERPWVSYPGLFARGELDPATEMLLDTVKEERFKRAALDFCAGQGMIAATLLQRHPELVVHGLDSDTLAKAAFEENLPGTPFFLSDSWRGLSPQNRYSAILSNPPIHQGRAEDQRVLNELIEQAPKWLERKGILWLVTQKRILVEKRLRAQFRYVSCPAESSRFWVWRAQN